jgi:predicted dehydrogenase
MDSKLRAGVIGLGILGRQHAQTLHAHAQVDVVAVADVRSEVAQQLGGELDAQPYADYREMLQAQGLDMVVVATPDHLHREPTVAAIEAGVRNILQEKPLATTAADGRAIYEAAERRGARVFVDFANRASVLDRATRYVLQAGLLGRVVYGESRLDDNISVPTKMWGARTREWVASSSSAHFLLSHVVDLLRWYFAPAEVTDVFAIAQQEVLGYTPDVYDAFLTFDSGMKIRVKAEWIKYIDELVEFYMCFSGSEGTLVYNKRAGFGGTDGWRANLSGKLGAVGLLQHREQLLAKGINVSARIHQPMPSTGQLSAGGDETMLSLEKLGPSHGGTMALVGPIVDAILEETLEPVCWQDNGPLPTHVDGLRQTLVVAAIEESSQRGEPVTVKY